MEHWVRRHDVSIMVQLFGDNAIFLLMDLLPLTNTTKNTLFDFILIIIDRSPRSTPPGQNVFILLSFQLGSVSSTFIIPGT